MRFFYVTAIFVFLDLAWWFVADRIARRTVNPKCWRRIAGVTGGLALLGIGLLLLARMIGMKSMIMPELAVIAVFLWHFLIVLPAILVTLPFLAFGRKKPLAVVPPDAVPEGVPANVVVVSRRDFLNRGLIALPPLAVAALTAESKKNEDALRQRNFDLPYKDLPPELDGLTIAHVTDPHLGSFITDAKVKNIIEMVNNIDADLVLQTGDLINQSLGDLPDGIEMLRKFRSRYGVYSCQGNHDCIDDREKFEAELPRAGLNLLLDEARIIDVRGTKLRLMAPRWWGYKEDVIQWSVKELVPDQPDGLFNLLMVHHPHGFDTAAANNVHLTLSGHTHGGQVALTQNIGVGPAMYRYWSGQYTKGDHQAIVSNGTGNWFPLRINVPCEILKITLHRA
ncbi:MAG: metallophosphoesterase [Tepidisphaeraceae bacterium]